MTPRRSVPTTWCHHLVLGLGLGCALVMWSVGAVVAAYALASLVGLVALDAFGAHQHRVPGQTDPGRPAGWPSAELVRSASHVGLGAVSVTALIALSAPLGLVLGVLLMVTSSRVRLPRGPRRSAPSVSPASPRPVAPTSPATRSAATLAARVEQARVAALSTPDLCAAWRLSFDSLRDEDDPVLRASIVSLRQACLDELERRHPDGLNAWLSSGASASGSPERFLSGTGT